MTELEKKLIDLGYERGLTYYLYPEFKTTKFAKAITYNVPIIIEIENDKEIRDAFVDPTYYKK